MMLGIMLIKSGQLWAIISCCAVGLDGTRERVKQFSRTEPKQTVVASRV